MDEVKIEEIFINVAGAIEQAVADHGPAVVDLTLLAYRVEAAQLIILGIAVLIPFLFVKRAWVRICSYNETLDYLDKGHPIFGFVLALFIYTICALMVAVPAFNVVNFMAVFGYPEIMIATQALKAGGLL